MKQPQVQVKKGWAEVLELLQRYIFCGYRRVNEVLLMCFKGEDQKAGKKAYEKQVRTCNFRWLKD